MNQKNVEGYSFIAILFSVTIVAVLAVVALKQYTQVNPETGESKISESRSIIDETQSLADKLNQQARDKNTLINKDEIMQHTTDDLSSITRAILKTSKGDITVKFYKNESPKTVENFVKLANNNFYDGTRFHRVIKNFMIQGGDPLSKDDSLAPRWGTGDPGYKFADEFNDHKLIKGSLAMANSGPNTNGSQFFIVTLDATPWLDGKHTNFGYVIDGIDVVDAIENSATQLGDRPLEPITILDIVLK